MTQPNPVPLPEPGKPRLLDQVRNRCRVRHLRPKTERAYVNWVRRFVVFHHMRHPLEMGAKEVTEFLTHLAVEGQVAASTQNQALSALLFLYREVLERDFGWLDNVVRARKPKTLPVVYSPEEAMGIIGELKGRRWLMGMQLYGGGLRLNECLQQRVKDLDFERLQITVRDGKGEKARVTLLHKSKQSLEQKATEETEKINTLCYLRSLMFKTTFHDAWPGVKPTRAQRRNGTMYRSLLSVMVTTLLILAVTGARTAFGQAVGTMSLEDLRQARHQLAHRQRRIMMNNDGCDVLYFPADEKATAEGCRDLVVSVSMASAPGNARNGR